MRRVLFALSAACLSSSAQADNSFTFIAQRVAVDGAAPIALALEITLDDPAVTAVTATDPSAVLYALEQAEDGTWDTQLPFATVAAMAAAAHGTWTIEITGPSPSTSTTFFDTSGYVDATIPPVATDVFPGDDKGCVDPDLTATWTDPTGGTADGIFVLICGGSEFACQEDDSVFGSLAPTDTSWSPPRPLEAGFAVFQIAYFNYGDAMAISALEVVEGSIEWGTDPIAPKGYPAGTPLLINASQVVTFFSTGAPGPSLIAFIGREQLSGDPDLFHVDFEVDLPGVVGVTGVKMTSPTGTEYFSDFPEGTLWDLGPGFDTFEDLVLESNGTWTIEVLGAQPSVSSFVLLSSSFSASEIYALPETLAPAEGAQVPQDVVFNWTNPTGGSPADFLGVEVFDDFETVAEASTLDGELETSDTTWAPAKPLPPGDFTWYVGYAKVDSLFRITPLTVLSGSIGWTTSCYAPFGYPPGFPLLVYGSGAEADFTVLEGSGGGTAFDPPIEVGAITEARGIGVTDFSGGNGNDIIVPMTADAPGPTGNVAVFLNDGTGVGFERVLTPVGADPSGVAWGDFDGVDGPDAAVTNSGDDTVTILLNDGLGAGTFLTAQIIAVGPTPADVDAGDADGDGDLDLIVTHFGDGTAVLLRNAGGTFAAEEPFPVGVGPRGVSFLPHDSVPAPGGGGLDIAIADETNGEIAVFANDGSGSFSETDRAAVGGSPLTVDPEDLDHDKDRDMVIGACDTTAVTILSGDGAGGFEIITIEVGTCPSDLALGDFDGDGDTDIVVVRDLPASTERGALILDNRLESGRLEFVGAGEAATAEGLDLVFAGRLDGDDRIDLVTAASVGGVGSIAVVPNSTETAPGDVNGDSIVDVVDLLAVLSNWGPCPAPPVTCPADLNDDAVVGVADLLAVLANWS